jgi:hypothetical protein
MILINNDLYFDRIEKKVILDKAIDILFDDATSTDQLTAFFQRFNCVCAKYKNGILVDTIEYAKKVYQISDGELYNSGRGNKKLYRIQCMLYHILHHRLCVSKKHLMIVFKKDRTTITHALLTYTPSKETMDKFIQGFNKYREDISE